MDEERTQTLAKYVLWGFIGLIVLLILLAMFSSLFKTKKSVVTETKSINLVVGDKYNFDSEYGTYTSKNTNDNIAVVTNTGEIEALEEGTTEIVISTDSKIVTYIVKVEEDKSLVVQNVKMQSNTIQIEKDKEYRMSVNIIPNNAKNVDLTWYSSNEKVATVSQDGVIKGLAAGSAMITVKTSNGNSDTCLVKVKDTEEVVINVDEINFDVTELTLKKGTNYTLTYKIKPESATSKLVWMSSDTTVVKVEDGVITTLETGSATITAKSGNGSATCYITVVEETEPEPEPDDSKVIEVDSVLINQTELSIVKGTKYTLIADIRPYDATDKTHTWESTDSTVVKVDKDGNIEAVSVGVADVKVTTTNGKVAECSIRVIDGGATPSTEYTISLDTTKVSLEVGQAVQLHETISPDNTHTMSITWSSSNPAVATVVNGQVTAIKEGSTLITVTLENGSKATTNITVTKKEIRPIQISLNSDYVNMRVNGTFQLYATILPKDTTNKTITWTSSDSNIVSVNSNGKLTAKKKGRVKITAKAHNGVKAECIVVVS